MKKQKLMYFNDNYCVSCGIQIPEGIMVCKNCLDKEENNDFSSDINKYEKIFNKQKKRLTSIDGVFND